MLDLWAECGGPSAIGPIGGELVRVVESQEQVATRALVDDLDEQALLEELLEASKPLAPPSGRGFGYLLATPFRYPPLPQGSRFGGRHEPSLLYGSSTLLVALAETAYYRCLFWSGMTRPPPKSRLTTEHTVFGVGYRTALGIRLQGAAFARFRAEIAHPADYAPSQRLGAAMRADGVEAFEYPSARDPQGGLNVALFTPSPFTRRTPEWQQAWLCDTGAERVSFYNPQAGATSFDRTRFLWQGRLPAPAI